jgi:hypothetical protein
MMGWVASSRQVASEIFGEWLIGYGPRFLLWCGFLDSGCLGGASWP